MRFTGCRGLVVFLVLALLGAGVPASAHAAPAHAEHCAGMANHHSDHQAADLSCCCDGLGCVAAFLPAPGGQVLAPRPVPILLRPLPAAALHAMTPLPDPDPPRPIA
jgi:hypothetical protein